MIKKLLLNIKQVAPCLSSKKLSSIYVMLFSFLGLNAQVSEYAFQQSIGVYTPITTTNPAIVPGELDSHTSPLTNIGFNFVFNGITYTQFTATSNGFIKLGTTAANSYASSPFTATAEMPAIAFFARDGKSGTEGVFHTVTGTAPNRVLTIEFKDYRPYYSSATILLSAQIKLYETSNIVEIVYGPSTGGTTAYFGQVGIASSLTDVQNRIATTNWSTSTNATPGATASATNAMTFSSTVKPTEGLTYSWTPSSCASPSNRTVTNITTSSFEINATSSSSPTFEYEVRTSGLPGTGASGLVQTQQNVVAPFTVNGLQASQSYQVYIRTICTESTSTWQQINVSTLCGIFELPLIQGFNSSTVPNCWTNTIITGATGISFVESSTAPNATAIEGTHMLKHNYALNRQERFTTPVINTVGINTLRLEFDFYHSSIGPSYNDSLIVEFSTNNGVSWTRIAGIKRHSATDGWATKSYILPATAGNQAELLVGLRFKSNNGYNMYVDAFELTEVPNPLYTAITGNLACSATTSTVSIIGQNLTDAVVTIDGQEVALTTNTYTSIVFEATTGTTGTIVVTTPNGTFTVAEQVDILTPPALTLANTNASICASTEVEVNLSSPVIDYDQYTWLPQANGIVSGDEVNGYLLSASQTTDFTIEGTLNLGNVTCTNRATFTYNVEPAPFVNTNFTTVTICEEEVQELSFTSRQITSTADNPNPFRTNFRGVKTQTVLLASELQAMGITPANGLTSLIIDAELLADRTYTGFRVRIGNSSVSSMGETFVSDLTTVYQSVYTLQDGTNTFEFDQPFFWDGVSNLIIETAFRNDNFILANNPLTDQINTTHLSSVVFQSDNIATAEGIYTSTTANVVATNKRINYLFGTQIPLQPISENSITWTGNNLYSDYTTNVAYTNESNPTVYFKAGTTSEDIIVTVTNATGCTTEKTYNINVNAFDRVTLTEQNCAYYQHLGQILTTSGTYIDTLNSITGCDSIITLNLSITSNTVKYISAVNCGAYDFNGELITTSGTYTSVFQSSIGCDSTVHLTIQIVDMVSTYITNIGSTLIAHPSSEDVIYQWVNCATNQVIPNAQSREFTPTEFGTYKVRVIQGDCNGESLCVVYGTAGVTYLDAIELTATPNPTVDFVTINYTGNEEMNLEILDTSGKIMTSSVITSGTIVDLSSYAKGIYILHIGTTNKKQILRVVKN